MGFFGDVGDFLGDVVDTVSDVGSNIWDNIDGTLEDGLDLITTIGGNVLPFIPGLNTLFAPFPQFPQFPVFGGGFPSSSTSQTIILQQPPLDLLSLVEPLSEALLPVVDALTDNVSQSLDNVLDAAIEVNRNLSNQIVRSVDTAATELAETDRQNAQRIIDPTVELIRGATERAVTHADQSTGIIDSVHRNALNSIADTGISVRNRADAALKAQFDEQARLTEQILDRTDTSVIRSLQVWDLIARATREFLDAIGEGASGLANVLRERLDNINMALRFMQIAQSELMGQLFGLSDDNRPGEYWRGLDSLTRPGIAGLGDDLDPVLAQALDPDRPLCMTREEWRAWIEQITPESGLGRAAWSLISGALMLWSTFGTITQLQAATLIQEYALDCPYQLMQPPDVVKALHRGLIDRDTAILNLRRQGYTAEDADKLLTIGDTLPMETELASMWLRGIVSEPAFDGAMSQKGWSAFWTDRLKDLVFFIPPVADLVTMAVREVFDRPTAEAQGQFEDFPEDFANWAKQQGVSRQWAENYWAAHWGLPSPQAGYEMLHRGIINEEQLKELLRALDVMPGWRDEMIAISYSPYTRVDIRRMHDMGFLTREDVKRAYMDIGYDEAKAENLTRFTEELNKDAPEDEDLELKQATRANVVSFYADGIIDRAVAALMLARLEYSPEAIALYLEQADLDNERAERKAEADLVKAQAKAGVINQAQVEDRLNSLDFSQAEIGRVLTDLRRADLKKDRLPSLTMLKDMFGAGIIERDEYLDTVRRHGYSLTWSERIVTLTAGGENGDDQTG